MSNTVRKITATGVVTTFAGSAGLSGTADGTGSAARFNRPTGVAVDGEGNVYVADSNNSTIRKITSAGEVTTFAGAAGNVGSADGTGAAAQFAFPHGVAVDGTNNVYVTDTSNDTIRKITPAGLVSTFAGTAGSAGSLDATGSAAQFRYPYALAVDSSNNVYVADNNNQTIRKITAAGVVTTLAGVAGSPGSADGTGSAARFCRPQGVAVDGSGNVFVADAGNSRIRKISTAGAVTTYSDISGTKGWTAGSGTWVLFNDAPGVAVDGTGNVYVADLFNYSIRKISVDGTTLTTLAGLASTAGAVDGTGGAAQFNTPQGVAVDGAGNLYVADTNNSTIRRISAAGVTTTFAGTAGSSGSTDATGTVARFSAPSGVAVDGAGNVYVADYNNQAIRKITPAGQVNTVATLFSSPRGIAVDGAGNIYVADSGNTISKITTRGVVTTLAGLVGSAGSNDGTGSAARFNYPVGVAVDVAGNIYVADSNNITIRKITSDGIVTTFAGVAGARGVVDGTASSARFVFPVGVAVDGAGNIYVTDSIGIRKITPAGAVTSIAGGYWGSLDGTGASVQFANASGITVDGAGVLWVADTLNNTIRKGVLAPPIFTSTTTASGNLNQSFDFTATFSGEPTSFSASGLPAGLNCNVTTGVIMGVPTAAGSFVVTLAATNAAGTGTATFTLTIAKGNQTISFGALADKIFGAASFTVSATSDSGLSPTFSIVSGPATISGQTVTLTGAGTVVVRASQAGDSNFNAAADVDQSFSVAKAPAVVTLVNLSATYGGSAHAATATTNPASLMVNLTYDGSTTAPTNAGTYAIVGTINDANYQGSASGTLIVAKATPIVIWTTPSPIFFGTALSGAQLNALANTEGTFVYTPAAGEIRAAGLHALSVSFTPADTVNYSGASFQQSLVVHVANGAPLFITQPASQSVPIGSSWTLTSFAIGAPDPTYQWQREGVNISGATGASYTIANIVGGDAGSYTVVVTNAVGSVTSNPAVLTTFVAAPSNAVISITVE